MRHPCLALLLALAEAREFEFVSAERAGSRRSCGGAHYVPGTHSGELHAKALERRQREREEQALLEPSFLETAMVPPAMQMPPPYFLNPWLYASMMAYPGLHPVAMRSPLPPKTAGEEQEVQGLTRGIVRAGDGYVDSGKGFCAAALAPGVIDVCFGKSYASRPTVVLTQQHPTSATGKLTLEQLRWVQTTDNCVVVSSCSCGFTAVCGDATGNSQNQGGALEEPFSRLMHFIADGPTVSAEKDGPDKQCLEIAIPEDAQVEVGPEAEAAEAAADETRDVPIPDLEVFDGRRSKHGAAPHYRCAA